MANQVKHWLREMQDFTAIGSWRVQLTPLDWFILTSLIHDLGKVLFLQVGLVIDKHSFSSFRRSLVMLGIDCVLSIQGEPQHLVVGDTFPLGLPFSDKIVYANYFKENPDLHCESYQRSPYGIYKPGIGLDNVVMSFGRPYDCTTLIRKELTMWPFQTRSWRLSGKGLSALSP